MWGHSLNPKVHFNIEKQKMQLICVLKHVPVPDLTAGMKRETTSIIFTEDMFTLKSQKKT